MTRDAYTDPLLDLAYGELPAREAREVEAHAASCEACRAELAQIRGTRRTMAALPEEPAPEQGERILLAAARQAAEARRPRRLVPRWLLGGVAVAASVVVVGVVSYRVAELSPRRDERTAILGESRYASPPPGEDRGAAPAPEAPTSGVDTAENEVGAARKVEAAPERAVRRAEPPRVAQAPPQRGLRREEGPLDAGAGYAAPPPAAAAPRAVAAARPPAAPAERERPEAPEASVGGVPLAYERVPAPGAPAPAPAAPPVPAAPRPQGGGIASGGRAAAPEMRKSAAAPEARREPPGGEVAAADAALAGGPRAETRSFQGCEGEAVRRVERDARGSVVRYVREGRIDGRRLRIVHAFGADGRLATVTVTDLDAPGAALDARALGLSLPARAEEAGVDAAPRCGR